MATGTGSNSRQNRCNHGNRSARH